MKHIQLIFHGSSPLHLNASPSFHICFQTAKPCSFQRNRRYALNLIGAVWIRGFVINSLFSGSRKYSTNSSQAIVFFHFSSREQIHRWTNFLKVFTSAFTTRQKWRFGHSDTCSPQESSHLHFFHLHQRLHSPHLHLQLLVLSYLSFSVQQLQVASIYRPSLNCDTKDGMENFFTRKFDAVCFSHSTL